MARHKVIKGDFSVKGINSIIKQLQQYSDDLQNRVDLLVETLADNGVKVAKAKIINYDAVFKSDLINSLKSISGGSSREQAIFFIVADSKHAAFVEFGTGQMGAKTPYPYPLPEGVTWETTADENGGWKNRIFEFAPGQYGWFYLDSERKLHFTQGMPSRPFMYETGMELRNIVEKTARQVFRL